MQSRRIAVISCAALVAAAVSLSPLACAGGAGAIGIGIATIGISAIFPGASPGWRVTDTRFAGPAGAPPDVLTSGGLPGVPGPAPVTSTVTPSDPLRLAPGETLDRVIIAGGRIVGRVTIRGRAVATGAGSTLQATLVHTAWANGGRNHTQLAAATATVPGGTTGTGTIVLDFSRFDDGTATFTDFRSDPGDTFTIRLENTGAQDIEIDPAGTRVDYVSTQRRVSELSFTPDRGGAFLIDDRQPRTLVSNSGVVRQLEAFTPRITAARNQLTLVRALVKDIDANPIPGATLSVQAAGSTTPSFQLSSNANGVAVAQLTWASVGAFQVTFTAGAAGTVPPEVVDVAVVTTTARAFDGLVGFLAQSQTLSADVLIDLTALLDGAGSDFRTQAGETTFPEQLVFEFANDASVQLEWGYDIAARTASFQSGASATFVVRVRDANNALIAQSPTETVGTALERKRGKMTQLKPLLIVGQGGVRAGPTAGPFRISLEGITSTDPVAPGVEFITDEAVGSHVYAPGPTVYGVRAGASFLASSPDPRR